jgi:hypothetical protein
MKNFGVLRGRLVFLLPFWYILWPCCCHFVTFLPTLFFFHREKSGNPAMKFFGAKLKF